MSTYTVQKQLFSALGIKTFTKQVVARLTALAFFSVFVASCVGTSNVPVNYILPKNDEVFTPATFKPKVEFPNGIPAQSSVTIRLNGADITDDFDSWGGIIGEVTEKVSPTNTPLIWGALRDGRNTFQVYEPNKAMVTFNIDMPSTSIHISDVKDGWDGFQGSAKIAVGGISNSVLVSGYLEGDDYADIQSMTVQMYKLTTTGALAGITPDANGYIMTATPGTTTTEGNYFLTLNDAQGGALLSTLGTFETPELTDVAPNNYAYASIPTGWTTTASGAGMSENGSAFGHPVAPEGDQVVFVQGVGTLERTFNIATAGKRALKMSAAQRGGVVAGCASSTTPASNCQVLAVFVDDIKVGEIQPTSTAFSNYSVNLGILTAGDHTLELRGLNPFGGDNTIFIDNVQLLNSASGAYSFTFRAYDAYDGDADYQDTDTDLLRISITDTQGSSFKQWLRPFVPLYKQVMGGNAVSVALDQIALMSTGDGIATALDANPLITPSNPFHYEECLAWLIVCIANLEVDITGMDSDNSTVGLTLSTTPSATQSQINVLVDLNIVTFNGVVGVSFIDCYLTPGVVYFTGSFTVSADAAGVTSLNSVGSPVVDAAGVVSGACGSLVGIFQGLLSDIITDVIATLVEGVLNNDLPLMRMMLKFGEEIQPMVHSNCWQQDEPCDPPQYPAAGSYFPGEYAFGPYILNLNPKTSGFYQTKNTWDTADTAWNYAWGLNLGFHTKGSGTLRRPSIGSIYAPFTISNASLAYGTTSAQQKLNVRTLGASLSENFLNQLMMGLWESGILYIDMGFGDIPANKNPLLDDVKFVFASDSPWEFTVLDSEAADFSTKGNVVITIPDLTIAFVGDIHYPTFKDDFEFAYMYADVQLSILLSESSDGGLRIQSVSAVEVTVNEISSDWDGTTEAEMIALFDYVLTYLTGGQGFSIGLPDILYSNVEFGKVWSKPGQLYATMDVYNSAMFPMSPGDMMISTSLYNAALCYGGAFSQIENRVEDGSFHVCPTPANGYRTWSLGACTTNHVHTGSYTTSDSDHCHRYANAVWTTHPPYSSLGWGFGFKTLRAQTVTQVALDERTGQEGRAGNIKLYLYLNGVAVGAAGGYTSTDTGALRVYTIPDIAADEYRFYVPNNTSATWYATPPDYNNENGTWFNGTLTPTITEATFQSQNGIGKTSSNEYIINFSEVIITAK